MSYRKIASALGFIVILVALVVALYSVISYTEELGKARKEVSRSLLELNQQMLSQQAMLEAELGSFKSLHASVSTQLSSCLALVERVLRQQPSNLPPDESNVDVAVEQMEPTPEDVARNASIEQREEAAKRKYLEAMEDPYLKQLFQTYTLGDKCWPNWTIDYFLTDAATNPDGTQLEEQKRILFDTLYTKAYQKIESLHLRQKVAIGQAVIDILTEEIENPPDRTAAPAEPKKVDVAAVLSIGNRTFVIPRDKYPEIAVLNSERQMATIDWFKEVQSFFQGR